jgi:hypothetical protein
LERTSVIAGIQIRNAAKLAAAAGVVPVALGLDAKGKPKRPIVGAWQELTLDTWERQPWDRALGIGNVLGPASGNRGVIDIDDLSLSDAAFALFLRKHTDARLVRSGSGCLHIHVVEERATPRKRKVIGMFQGRKVTLDLLVQGALAVVPPTPGYSLTGYKDRLGSQPMRVPSIGQAWASLARHLGVQEITPPRSAGGQREPIPATIPTGARHGVFVRIAGALRRIGAEASEITACLEVFNERCDEPSPVEHLERIARDVARRYAPAAPLVRPADDTDAEARFLASVLR